MTEAEYVAAFEGARKAYKRCIDSINSERDKRMSSNSPGDSDREYVAGLEAAVRIVEDLSMSVGKD